MSLGELMGIARGNRPYILTEDDSKRLSAIAGEIENCAEYGDRDARYLRLLAFAAHIGVSEIEP